MARPDALSDADLELVHLARDLIHRRYRSGWHAVAAALRLENGRTFTGVHLEAHVGRVAVCAEAIALGRAATECGDTRVMTIVGVRQSHADQPLASIPVVPPCGMCRELISDYSTAAVFLLAGPDGTLRARRVSDLLPDKYRR